MSTLEEIKARAEANQYLGKTASQDEAKATLKLIAALEAVEALLDENATQFRATADRLNQQVMDRDPDRDVDVASRYANYATSWEAARRMVHGSITEALA